MLVSPLVGLPFLFSSLRLRIFCRSSSPTFLSCPSSYFANFFFALSSICRLLPPSRLFGFLLFRTGGSFSLFDPLIWLASVSTAVYNYSSARWTPIRSIALFYLLEISRARRNVKYKLKSKYISLYFSRTSIMRYPNTYGRLVYQTTACCTQSLNLNIKPKTLVTKKSFISN